MPKILVSLSILRVALLALLFGGSCISSIHAAEDRFASDPALRRFVDSQHGDVVAIELGRLVYRKRWNDVLDQALYVIAPRGTWDEKHPAWAPAREALARVLREESVRWLAANRGDVRMIVNEQSMRVMTEDERRQTTEFFESQAGKVFLATRETFLRERAYGLPLEIEKESLDQIKRMHAAAEAVLLALPEEGDGKVVYNFFHGGPGDKLQKLQLDQWGAIVANMFSNTLESYVRDHKSALAATVRAAVPGMPASSDKLYLGTVAMGADRSYTVIVEHYDHLRYIGKYTLSYAPNEPHWNDIATAAPNIKPGETRSLYRDAAGQLSDRP